MWLVRISSFYSSPRAPGNRSQCLLRLNLTRHRPVSSAAFAGEDLRWKQALLKILTCSQNSSFGIAPCHIVMGSSKLSRHKLSNLLWEQLLVAAWRTRRAFEQGAWVCSALLLTAWTVCGVWAYTAFWKHQAGRGYRHSDGQDQNYQLSSVPHKRKSEMNK